MEKADLEKRQEKAGSQWDQWDYKWVVTFPKLKTTQAHTKTPTPDLYLSVSALLTTLQSFKSF